VDLEFTDEQASLRAAVRDVLARECPTAVVRGLAERDEYPDEIWTRMVELDWPLLTVPEAAGGVGYGFVELAVVAEELGRSIVPSRFEAVATQYQPLLLELGASIDRNCTGTLAVAEGDDWSAAQVATVVADGRVSGTKRWVFDAGAVDELLVVARNADGAAIVVRVDTRDPGVDIRPVRNVDVTRRLAHVTFTAAAAEPVGAAGPGTEAAVTAVVHRAAAVLALETVGTCQTVFDMTLQYAKDRHQFGVPIGSFQAVKHKLADMFVVLERARALAYFAALAIAEGDERATIAVAMAKAAAGDAQELVGREAIQIHGGIGYTWEHDLHLFVKRAIADDVLFGSADRHRERIAALLVAPSPRVP